MSIYPIAYMVETIIFHHPTNHIHHHHHLSLLTLCGKRVKQSQTVRSGRFELNLLTWPGRPNTRMGIDVSLRPRDFSPFFPGCGSGSPTSSTRIHATVRRRVVSLLAPACGRMRTTFKEGEGKVHSPGRSGTSAYRLPYSSACG